MNLSRVMPIAMDTARRAGRIIRQPLGQASVAQEKGPAEVVTAADPAAEGAILETIHKIFQPAADTISATGTGIHDEPPALPAVEGHL